MDGLQRRIDSGDVIRIGECIVVEVLGVGASPRLRIVAPRDIPIVHTRRTDETERETPTCLDLQRA